MLNSWFTSLLILITIRNHYQLNPHCSLRATFMIQLEIYIAIDFGNWIAHQFGLIICFVIEWSAHQYNQRALCYHWWSHNIKQANVGIWLTYRKRNKTNWRAQSQVAMKEYQPKLSSEMCTYNFPSGGSMSGCLVETASDSLDTKESTRYWNINEPPKWILWINDARTY